MAVKSVLLGALLAATSVAGAALKWIEGASFSNQINLGAVIVGLLVVVVAGMFTIRANVAKVWRENYEGEKEKVAQLTEELGQRSAELLEQREAKHAALAQVAALKLTDQAAVLRALAQMQEQARVAGEQATDKVVAAIGAAQEPLVEELRKLAERIKSQAG